MRRLLITFLMLITIAGCQSSVFKDPQAIEVRSHTVAPRQIQHLDEWQETITETVAPEDWNHADSDHRISSHGNVLTIRMTQENQEVIFEYLATVMTTPK